MQRADQPEPELAAIEDVARAARVSIATVSAVMNETAFVNAELKGRVAAAICELDCHPISVARIVCPAEAAIAFRGSTMVVFNSDEQPEQERRILARVRTLSCDGVMPVPVAATMPPPPRAPGAGPPTVLSGRELPAHRYDSVTLDNVTTGRQVTDYLLDLGHRRVAAITGPLHVTTGRDRLEGSRAAMAGRGQAAAPDHVRQAT